MLQGDIPVMIFTPQNNQALSSSRIDVDDGSHTQINSAFGNNPPVSPEFIEIQLEDTYSNQARRYIGLPNIAFTYDQNGTSLRKVPINCAIQKVVPSSFRTRLLNLAHYSLLSTHAGEHWMYESLKREFY